ncbi:STAS domain-containing protein [Streptomyces sp. NPDC046939]|uniref:STAS domain-containing protein n=1 Tax=Streptomyces sp. NPDC046939 TaxID=3155376 RepID=UPI00340A6C02
MAVHGEADMDAGPGWERELRSALDEAPQGVDLDLEPLRFCDCVGLGVLLRVRQAAVETGKDVTIRSASPGVSRLLQLTGTYTLFAEPLGVS